MSRKGNHLGNAVVASSSHTFKAELVHEDEFANRIEAVAQIVEYIEFYHRERPHSHLGYKTPEDNGKLCV